MKETKEKTNIEWAQRVNDNALQGWLRNQPETTLFIIRRAEGKPAYRLGGAFVPDNDEQTKVYTIESAKKAAEQYFIKWVTRNASRDTERLNWLEKFLRLLPHGVVAFNDDPDIDCEESDNGLLPVGFRISSTGCRGTICDVGISLREVIDKSIERDNTETPAQ